MPGFGANAIESPQRLMNVISVKKSGLGTPALSGSCANFLEITDTGVGDYLISLKSNAVPFAQLPEILVSCKTAERVLNVGAVTITSVQILAFADDGTTPAEADFDLMMVGSQARDLIG